MAIFHHSNQCTYLERLNFPAFCQWYPKFTVTHLAQYHLKKSTTKRLLFSNKAPSLVSATTIRYIKTESTKSSSSVLSYGAPINTWVGQSAFEGTWLLRCSPHSEDKRQLATRINASIFTISIGKVVKLHEVRSKFVYISYIHAKFECCRRKHWNSVEKKQVWVFGFSKCQPTQMVSLHWREKNANAKFWNLYRVHFWSSIFSFDFLKDLEFLHFLTFYIDGWKPTKDLQD